MHFLYEVILSTRNLDYGKILVFSKRLYFPLIKFATLDDHLLSGYSRHMVSDL